MLEDDVDVSDWAAAAEEQEQEQEQAERAKKGDARREWPREQDAKAPPARPQFTFTHVGDLVVTEPEFHIEDWVEKNSIGYIVGAPGSFKTFFALAWALCVASGTPFYGYDVEQGTVFYIAGEGHNGLARRVEAWARKNGVCRSKVRAFTSDRGARFLDKAHAADVTNAILGLVAIHGPPSLIVIDTLARNYGPGDENSTEDMTAFVAAMDDLRGNWQGCTIVLVHHTGHDNKSRGRGSSVRIGAADWEFCTERKDKHSPVCVINTKMKEATERADEWFALEIVDLGMLDKKGRPVTSGILVPTGAKDSGTGQKLGKNAKIARDAYVEAASTNGIWDHDSLLGVSKGDWRATFDETSPDLKPESRAKTFNRALEELEAAGLMTREGDAYLAVEGEIVMAIALKRGRPDKADRTGQT